MTARLDRYFGQWITSARLLCLQALEQRRQSAWFVIRPLSFKKNDHSALTFAETARLLAQDRKFQAIQDENYANTQYALDMSREKLYADAEAGSAP